MWQFRLLLIHLQDKDLGCTDDTVLSQMELWAWIVQCHIKWVSLWKTHQLVLQCCQQNLSSIFGLRDKFHLSWILPCYYFVERNIHHWFLPHSHPSINFLNKCPVAFLSYFESLEDFLWTTFAWRNHRKIQLSSFDPISRPESLQVSILLKVEAESQFTIHCCFEDRLFPLETA